MSLNLQTSNTSIQNEGQPESFKLSYQECQKVYASKANQKKLQKLKKGSKDFTTVSQVSYPNSNSNSNNTTQYPALNYQASRPESTIEISINDPKQYQLQQEKPKKSNFMSQSYQTPTRKKNQIEKKYNDDFSFNQSTAKKPKNDEIFQDPEPQIPDETSFMAISIPRKSQRKISQNFGNSSDVSQFQFNNNNNTNQKLQVYRGGRKPSPRKNSMLGKTNELNKGELMCLKKIVYDGKNKADLNIKRDKYLELMKCKKQSCTIQKIENPFKNNEQVFKGGRRMSIEKHICRICKKDTVNYKDAQIMACQCNNVITQENVCLECEKDFQDINSQIQKNITDYFQESKQICQKTLDCQLGKCEKSCRISSQKFLFRVIIGVLLILSLSLISTFLINEYLGYFFAMVGVLVLGGNLVYFMPERQKIIGNLDNLPYFLILECANSKQWCSNCQELIMANNKEIIQKYQFISG